MASSPIPVPASPRAPQAAARPLFVRPRAPRVERRRAAPGPTGPDAGLLEFGRRMDRLISTYEALPESLKPEQPCCCDLNDAMDPISRKIMNFPANTLAGLAVKARVAQHSAANIGTSHMTIAILTR